MTLETGQRNNGRRAFTLIELILVLALLVVAVSIVAPRMSDFIRGARAGFPKHGGCWRSRTPRKAAPFRRRCRWSFGWMKTKRLRT